MSACSNDNATVTKVGLSRKDPEMIYTVPLCMEETITRNAEVVSSPIHPYVTRNAGLVST